MRKLLDRATDRCKAFIHGRNDLAMIVRCAPEDCMPMLKILEGLEDQSASDFYWTVSDPFESVQEYVSRLVLTFRVRHDEVRLRMIEEKTTPWPPVPVEVIAEDAPPALRLRELMAFSRSLLPIPNGGMTVWIFFPPKIADQAAYAQLMSDVLQHEFPFPWCHHIRTILRDDSTSNSLASAIGEAPRVCRFEGDFSPNAMAASMQEEVEDDTIPLDHRLRTLLVMAGLDQAHNRCEDALEKYSLIVDYYRPRQEHVMTGIALHGMGETYARMGNGERAGECLESALQSAGLSDSPPPILLLNCVLSLASLRQAQERWPEVETWAELGRQFSIPCQNGPLKVMSIERRGVAQLKQGKDDQGVQSLALAAALAEKLEQPELARSPLQHLYDHFMRTQQEGPLRDVSRRLNAKSENQKDTAALRN